ncbi:ClpS-like protein [Exidia glandulosa HHB12029]|uniref:ClpS-like protein n=1 Tax=Exidia glandulosa HHB12029 TaxID=1314781 RepID=A0A165QX74_EXIGL|nr:ClpS-like protein [Exidia glandulosa HHB12029]
MFEPLATCCSSARRSLAAASRSMLARPSSSVSRRRLLHATVAAAQSTDPQISRIVDDISGLTLLQAADLVSALKTRLNITEIAMPAAAAAPVAAAADAEPAAEAEKPKEKTIFNVKLESFEATSKPKVIKEVKAIVPNLNLIEAKKFVESLPKIVKEGLTKDEAEKLKATFEALGAKVVLE